MPILEKGINVGQPSKRGNYPTRVALGHFRAGVGQRCAPQHAAKLILLDIEPVVEVCRRGDPQARTQVTAVEAKDRRGVLVLTTQYAISSDSEPCDIGGGRQSDRAAVRLEVQRQAGAELAEVPPQALSRIGGVRKEQLRQNVAVL